MFTGNRVKAAPVLWSQQVLTSGQLRAVVLNSGGANACTGPAGSKTPIAPPNTLPPAECGAGEVAVCSTGLIGERLPMDRLLAGVDKAAVDLSAGGGSDAADAICTTDTHRKEAAAHGGGVTSVAWPKVPACLPPGSPPCCV